MIQTLSRFFNPPLLVLTAALGVALQSSLFSWWPLNYLQPDVILIIVIWCGLKRDFEEGGILTLIVGEIAETHSSAPSGVFLIAYMLIYLGVRVTSKFFVIPSLPALASITLSCAIAWRLIVLLVLFLMGVPSSPIQHIVPYLCLGAAVEALLALKAFRWLEKFDWITYKNFRAEQMTDELQLGNEGL